MCHRAPYWPQTKWNTLRLIYGATAGPYPFLAAANNEVGFYVVFFQVGVPVPSCPRLHVVVPVQIVESGLGDMDASERTEPASQVCERLQRADPQPEDVRTQLVPPPPSDWLA